MTDEALPTAWRPIETATVRLEVPERWVDVPRDDWRTLGPVPDADAVAADPDRAPGRFRANAVVTSSATDEPIETVSRLLLDETAAIDAFSRTVAVDVWPHAGAPARRHEFVYAVGDGVVLVTTIVLVTGGHRVDTTFSRAIDARADTHRIGFAVTSSIRARAAVQA